MTSFRRGTRLGVDVGKARIGVARCDPDGMLATPVETVPRNDDATRRVRELAEECGAFEIVVGLPLSMDGSDTASTTDARDFAASLVMPEVGVRLVDERLTTVSAHSVLRQNGRSQRGSRSIVDQIAAVIILQNAIDVEKRTYTPPGFTVTTAQETPDHV